MKTINLQQLASHVRSERKLVLIEALPARYFLDDHLPGAININVGEVQDKAPGLLLVYSECRDLPDTRR